MAPAPIIPEEWSSTVIAEHDALGYFRPWELLITTNEMKNQSSDPL